MFEARFGDPPTLRLLREMTRATMAAAVSTVWGTFLAAATPDQLLTRVGDFWSVSFDTGRLVVVERGARAGASSPSRAGPSPPRAGGRHRGRGVRGVPGAHRRGRAARRRPAWSTGVWRLTARGSGVLPVDETAEVAGRRRAPPRRAPRARTGRAASPARRARDSAAARLATKSAVAVALASACQRARRRAGERAAGACSSPTAGDAPPPPWPTRPATRLNSAASTHGGAAEVARRTSKTKLMPHSTSGTWTTSVCGSGRDSDVTRRI